MIIAPPPVDDTCGDTLAANEIHAACSRRLWSPDGQWQVVIKGEDDPAPQVRIDRPFANDMAFVADRTGHVIANFEMQRFAALSWLIKDHLLVINYFEGSDLTRPLVIRLGQGRTTTIDLSKIVYADTLRRARIKDDWVYHDYTLFIRDDGAQLEIATEPWYVLPGHDTPGHSKCYVYSLDKIALQHSRFVGEADSEHCPLD